jgi:hypothetical protein
MSEAQAKSTPALPAPVPAPALLARKGLAAPANTARTSVPTPALSPAPAPALATDLVTDLVDLPETSAPAKGAPPQPASLLPLDFLAGRQGAGNLARLTSNRSAAIVDRAADTKADQPETAVAKISAKSPGPPPAESPGKPDTPRPDPAWRIDAGARPAARTEPRRFPALAVGVLLVIAAAGYGYWSGWFESGPPAPAAQPETAPAAQPGSPPESLSAVPPPETPSGTPSGTPPGTTVSETAPNVQAIQPSVDVVRIEPDGAAVIAGRAAPGAELILLDNGTPIGTVQADAYGEWVFVSIDPLPSGAHDFGLVIKKIEGGVSVPSLEKMPAKQDTTAPGVRKLNEPGTAAGADAAVPIPPRKPDIAAPRAVAVSFPAFVVQLASVKTRGGAEREWRTLQRRYPEILSEMTLSLDEAKLAGGNTVVRLRTGRFGKQAKAAELCARLADKHQDCLVVRTAAER